MIDPSAYPRPVPLSQADAHALARELGSWPDVAGTFLVFEMIPLESRIGEWRFVGAARSLLGAFERIAEFGMAFGAEPQAARDGIADLIGSTVLEVYQRLEDGWDRPPDLNKLSTHRVVFFGLGGAPYDCFGLCILEVEPEEGEPFFARLPETHYHDSPEEGEQYQQQKDAEREADWV
jgi:hypothetical protein